ncbi:hypothetical protein CH373_05080 [Leptospira perolatii]|uniref:NAD-dependent epimerase/dehydratase domain-containing protein n=1 Tax=Leptospira perolatii TaxID=2023191 RepID=A0A2M9ZQS9_9LEPT|nr:NAD-dependent epimerase/dehydratase family protein [Leptospira perolatii]PJZ70447.1 hypothetical protein CH360_05500 [Leptospira perolatii]PJZ74283.1 hypothetical protein CH373_05080 [Leptospira perolatii]
MANSNILLTGSTGFIGSALLNRLLNSQPKPKIKLLVRATSRLSPEIESNPNVQVVRLDFPNQPIPNSLMDEIDTVYHVAGTMTDWAKARDFEVGNFILTEQLISVSLANLQSSKPSLKRFVHVSTADVYGHPGTRPNENSPLKGARLPFGYAATKTRSDILVQEACKDRGLPAVILRPATVYGPGSKDVVAEIATLLVEGSMLFISGGKAKAGLVYIDDTVDALLLAGSVPGMEGEAFNVCGDKGGTGGDTTWREYCDLIADQLGVKRASVSIPFRIALFVGWLFEKTYALFGSYSHRPLVTRMAVYVTGRSQDADIEKAKSKLGFRPKVSVKEGVEKSLGWWKSLIEKSH